MAKGRKICCDHCDTPVAELVGATLVITVKHHGQKHTTVLALDDLEKLVLDKIAQK